MQIITHVQSPNFNERPEGCFPRFIILHYIEKPFDVAMTQYCDKDIKLSPHYAIKKTGEVYNLVADEKRAWHAGVSYWKGVENLNDHSIGIEIDNMGDEPFTDEQMNSCIELCHLLMKKHNIARENVLGHSDIAPDRKLDPGIFFDWKLLDKNKIGMKLAHDVLHMNVPELQQYLKDMGYKIEVTGAWNEQTDNVMRAFLAHFHPEEIWAHGGLEVYKH